MSLMLLVAFRVAQLINKGPDDFVYDEALLPYCYNSISEGFVCGFVFVPLFLIGASGALRQALSPLWVTRRLSRGLTAASCLSVLSARALAFSFVICSSGLVVVALRSGYSFGPEGYALLLLVYVPLETFFFVACGGLLLAMYYLARSITPAAAAVLCYGVLDYVDGLTVRSGAQLFYSGWALTMLDREEGPGDLAFKGLRLAVVAGLFATASVVCARRSDLIPREDENHGE